MDHFFSPKMDQDIIKKCIENGQKMNQYFTKMDQILIFKNYKNGPYMDHKKSKKWTKNGPNFLQNGHKISKMD